MNNEVYSFLDDQLDYLVDKFVGHLDGFYTRSELNKILDEYEISYEVYKFQQWLEENNYETKVDDVEIAVIAKEFKNKVMERFEN